jgi:hypothetical protein
VIVYWVLRCVIARERVAELAVSAPTGTATAAPETAA